MTPDLQKQWVALTRQAHDYLKAVPASGSFDQLFSIWMLPSFRNSFRWTMYSPRNNAKEKEPFASFTVWRQDLDIEKFESPVERLRYPHILVPTMEERSVLLTVSEIKELVSRLSNIAIPAFLTNPGGFGLDGTSFEFCYNRPFMSLSLRWWENYPPEWRPFTEAVNEVKCFLDGKIDQG